MQQVLAPKKQVKYIYGPDSKIRGDFQRIRITQGCIRQCPWCHEPKEAFVFSDVLGMLERNKIVIIDMNILDPRKPALKILKTLRDAHSAGNWYEMQCGFDYRAITPEIAALIYETRFGRFNRRGNWVREIRLAWDGPITEQYKIKDKINLLVKAGFNKNAISFFMITNHMIPMHECELKLDVLNRWGMKVCDCCFDGGYKDVVPVFWSRGEIDYFRHKCAIHNQLVEFDIFPDVRRAKRLKEKEVKYYATKINMVRTTNFAFV